MIEINKGRTKMTGDVITLSAELAAFFDSLNKCLDKQKDGIFEELIVCDDRAYKAFCKLAVRLNEAHKRSVDMVRDKNK